MEAPMDVLCQSHDGRQGKKTCMADHVVAVNTCVRSCCCIPDHGRQHELLVASVAVHEGCGVWPQLYGPTGGLDGAPAGAGDGTSSVEPSSVLPLETLTMVQIVPQIALIRQAVDKNTLACT